VFGMGDPDAVVAVAVTVTGVDDLVDDGDIAYGVVVGAAASSDPIYAAIDPADVVRAVRKMSVSGGSGDRHAK